MNISLTYGSSAVEPFTKEQLLDLLEFCQQNNRKLKVTGMLLYRESKFLQVLEGPADAVQHIFAAIKRDPRHSRIMKIFEGTITERQFPHWTMGFRDLDDIRADEDAGYASSLYEEPVGQVFPLDPVRARKLLVAFQQPV